jgi:hypothetical protein
MFAAGQKWHATRTGSGKHRDEVRTVFGLRGRDIVWKLDDGHLYHTEWPKAAEVLEARSGFLRFFYADVPGVEVTLARV